ncbi:hypothetical protein [Pedobacter sp. ASV28]|uniref:hypothetical protein n=1 Tax=Pedobacter sp. ASV28 TaxID=2795123 RepID=UPI0018EC243C|nr:hypothetical protein [Pedobacter sp. ASV28]
MKQENNDDVKLKNLQKQAFYKGYKNDLDAALQMHVDNQDKQFALTHQKSFGNEEMTSTLLYNRSDQGNYFLNKVEVELKKENGVLLKTGFYMDKNSDYTLKQMYNLLSGRFVEKEKETKEKVEYRAWDQLDLTTRDKYNNYPVLSYGERYGFNLKESLDREPLLANKNAEDRKLLEDALRRGNVEKVVYEIDGNLSSKFVVANVKMREIERYDSMTEYHKAKAGLMVANAVKENSSSQGAVQTTGADQTKNDQNLSNKNVEKTNMTDEEGPGNLKTDQKKSKKRGARL